MSTPILDRRYTFSDAALASGASPKAIRNWIDKKQVLLDADESRPSGKWRRFSVWDAVRLAYARRMIDSGVPVEFAGLMAGSLLVPVMRLLSYKNTPPDALTAALRGTQLMMWPDRSGWQTKIVKHGDDPLDITLPAAFFYMDVGRVTEEVIEILKDIEEGDAE